MPPSAGSSSVKQHNEPSTRNRKPAHRWWHSQSVKRTVLQPRRLVGRAAGRVVRVQPQRPAVKGQKLGAQTARYRGHQLLLREVGGDWAGGEHAWLCGLWF